ncbi:hypothetical protein EDB83DRAFT_2410190, partial [Lactarius deliciosus]
MLISSKLALVLNVSASEYACSIPSFATSTLLWHTSSPLIHAGLLRGTEPRSNNRHTLRHSKRYVFRFISYFSSTLL